MQMDQVSGPEQALNQLGPLGEMVQGRESALGMRKITPLFS